MSSLSSVVSALVRASMGSSVSSTVTDDDLDRHLAELILKEAKQKAERYGKQGVRAYLPEMCVAPGAPFQGYSRFCNGRPARAMPLARTSASFRPLSGAQ